MSKYPPMSHFEHFRSAINENKVFEEEGFENCVQVVFNKDGSADTYDFKTEKHLEHYK